MKFIENSSEEEILAEMMRIEKRASLENSDNAQRKNTKNKVFKLLLEAAEDFKAAGDNNKYNKIMKIAMNKNAGDLQTLDGIDLKLPERKPEPLADYFDESYNDEIAQDMDWTDGLEELFEDD